MTHFCRRGGGYCMHDYQMCFIVFLGPDILTLDVDLIHYLVASTYNKTAHGMMSMKLGMDTPHG